MEKDKRDRTEYQKEYRKNPEVIIRKREQGRKWMEQWRKDNPEKAKRNRKKYYNNGGKEYMQNWMNNTIKGRFRMYKDNCKRLGRPFELLFDDFAKFWKQPCSYCGSEIETIGLDRIDSEKGYIEGNVISCCFKCNGMKSKLSEKEFLEQIKKINNYQNGKQKNSTN